MLFMLPIQSLQKSLSAKIKRPASIKANILYVHLFHFMKWKQKNVIYLNGSIEKNDHPPYTDSTMKSPCQLND